MFTPLYNRKKLVKRLYQSLCEQDCQDFCWLVVDDGSTDGSGDVIKGFLSEGRIDITYIYQENSGKYVAHNTGVMHCETELFVCVDSDDWLAPEAVRRTLEKWASVSAKDYLCGILSPRKMEGSGFKKEPPEEESLMGLYNSGFLVGETMLVFRTEILKRFLFPVYPGERFMSENVIYAPISRQFKFAVQNELLYYGEYQASGLTKNIRSIYWKNPRAVLLGFYVEAICQISWIKAVQSYGCYLAWKRVRNVEIEVKEVPSLSVRIAAWMLLPHYYFLCRSWNPNR